MCKSTRSGKIMCPAHTCIGYYLGAYTGIVCPAHFPRKIGDNRFLQINHAIWFSAKQASKIPVGSERQAPRSLCNKIIPDGSSCQACSHTSNFQAIHLRGGCSPHHVTCSLYNFLVSKADDCIAHLSATHLESWHSPLPQLLPANSLCNTRKIFRKYTMQNGSPCPAPAGWRYKI